MRIIGYYGKMAARSRPFSSYGSTAPLIPGMRPAVTQPSPLWISCAEYHGLSFLYCLHYATGVKVLSSLPLQMLMCFNIYYSPMWALAVVLGLILKVWSKEDTTVGVAELIACDLCVGGQVSLMLSMNTRSPYHFDALSPCSSITSRHTTK